MGQKTRLPTPERLILRTLNEMEVAELIEQHIEFVDEKGRAVHLPMPFVRHYMQRDDGALPIVSSVSQLPIALPSGEILTGRGLNRKYGIIFRVPKELDALIPLKKIAVRLPLAARCDSSRTSGCAMSPRTTPASAPSSLRH
jgi:hypothetical protein